MNSTQPIAGVITNNSSNPLLSLDDASASMAISLAPTLGVDMKLEPAQAPSPSPRPTMTPFELLILLSWLSAGWRMLKRTQRMAGMMGSSSASPRLSPSAMSAICCRARAVSQQAKEEKMAPAKVVPRRIEGSELC